MKQTFTVRQDSSLLDALCARIVGVPRDRLAIQCKRGEVRIDGVKTRTNVQVRKGQTVEIFLPQKFDVPPIGVVYEDEQIAVVDKPPYMESEFALPSALQRQTGQTYTAVHRLDTNTTGIVVLAKTPQAESALTSAFRDGRVHKTYLARVFGCPSEPQARLTAYLRKDAALGYCRVFDHAAADAKRIETAYEVLLRGKESVLALHPLTGRTHQLRAHMAHIGCPIVGDDKYGDEAANKASGAKRQALRAVRIIFDALQSPLSYLSCKSFSVPVGSDIVREHENIPHLV